MVKHALTDETRTYISRRDHNFGLEAASPYLMLEQVIIPMAAALPETIHKEKADILGGLRRARSAMLRITTAGSEVEHVFGSPNAGSEAAVRALPKYVRKLQTTIDRITNQGEYLVPSNSNHVSTSEERAKEFSDYIDVFEKNFGVEKAASRQA